MPLGRILLVKQDRYSGYSNLLFKYNIAQGIELGHSALVASMDPHPDRLVEELMAVSKNSNKADEEFIPSQKSSNTIRTLGATRSNPDQLSIAWRYRDQPKLSSSLASSGTKIINSIVLFDLDAIYCNTFDLTKRIESEKLQSAHLHLFEPKLNGSIYEELLCQIDALLRSQEYQLGIPGKKNVLRIGINAIGSPLWGDQDEKQKYLYRFLHRLRSVIRSKAVTVFITIPAYLFDDYKITPQAGIQRIQHIVDAVVEVESFAGSPNPINEKYTSDYNGLIHPIHLFQQESLTGSSRLSNLQLHSLGFKVRRKRFSIEQFTLPPDDVDDPSKPALGSGCGSSGGKSPLDF
jgi:elongator complex protein 4